MATAGLAGPGVPAARAAPAVGGPGDLATPDHVDHHHRPAQYDDPTLAVPPASGLDPDYPLAVAFVPADSSNYTTGGISSYDYVVVHTMQGYYAGSQSWFQNPSANVSAHYVMRSEDGEVTQMVRDVDRAWHVGNSNPYALGIEHEGFIAEQGWYTWETYLSSARLTHWLCDAHQIPMDRDHIVGHVELPNQTHTDPGPLWDWDLYMALVHDVVSAGEIEGVVVDRSAACTLTANTDTWIKATLEDAGDLADGQRCAIAAGTSLTVLHESGDMVGHVRVSLDAEAGGSPCAGALAQEGFVWRGHFDGTCDPTAMAAAGATVILDGGTELEVDAQGRFVLGGVTPGGHQLDAIGSDYVDGGASIDLAVYPGARVVIGLDPIDAGGDTGIDPTGDPGGGSTGGDVPGTDDGLDGSGTGDLPGDGPAGTGGPDGPALPQGFGEHDGSGCACTLARPDAPSRWGGDAIGWALMGLLLGRTRRRRTTRRDL